jgi:MFS family permease
VSSDASDDPGDPRTRSDSALKARVPTVRLGNPARSGGHVSHGTMQRPSFSTVLADREFRAMWIAEALSQAGDQLARVALSVLVFERTGSATLTALTYALTLVPALVGGTLFGGLGDRYPRREVMVVADLARALLIGLAAVPHMPLAVLCVLVATMTLLSGPFGAAQQALLPDVLPADQYPVGMALRQTTIQAAFLAGFAGGGFLVTALTPSFGLAIDAATFVASAVLVRAWVGRRPAAVAVAEPPPFWRSSLVGARVIWRDPGMRALLILTWLAGLYIVPDAVAAPYAVAIGAAPSAVGLILASDPIGSVVGGVVFGRWVPARWQVRRLGLLAALAGAPLLACATKPPLAVSMLLFGLSGFFATAYHLHASTTLMRRLPVETRAQGSGLATSSLITVQGVGALLAGVLADRIGPAATIVTAGIAGICLATWIGTVWSHIDSAETG